MLSTSSASVYSSFTTSELNVPEHPSACQYEPVISFVSSVGTALEVTQAASSMAFSYISFLDAVSMAAISVPSNLTTVRNRLSSPASEMSTQKYELSYSAPRSSFMLTIYLIYSLSSTRIFSGYCSIV